MAVEKEELTSCLFRSLSLIVSNTLLSTKLVHVRPTLSIAAGVAFPLPSPDPSSTLTMEIDFLGASPAPEEEGAMILDINPENLPPPGVIDAD